jgi:tetratricopeptide (TPR) repeat protein
MTLLGKSSDWTATPKWIPLALVGALAVVAMSAVLGNRFAGDAIPLIVRNDHVHAVSDFPMRLLETYWPQVTLESEGRLYRPLTSILFSFEWTLGVGSPLLYHATSLALYLLSSLLMFALARRFLPPGPATFAAALFAVHPVHVEAVASITGQAELLGAVFALLSATVYVDGIGRGLTSTRLAVIVGGYVLGCLALGQVVVLPLALLLITPFIPSARPSRVAREDASRALVALAATAAAYLAVRHTVLGSLVGDIPHPAWLGTPASLRIMTMLSAVPVGLRLLLWPSHLQADYSPQEIELASGFGEGQVIGLVLVILFGLAIWWSRSRAKPIAAGLLWILVAVLPVANLFAPTSTILSEAGLFLPSVGACLIAGGLAAQVGSGRLGSIPGLREAVGGLALVLLAVSASYSGRRATVWYDTSTLHAQTVLDAPLSYRAWQGWGGELANQGRDTEAAGAKLRSLSLFDRDPAVYDDLATIQRRLGRCDRAVPLYRVALAFDPDRYSTAVRLVGCLVTLGDFAAAREEISLLSARGRPEYAGLEAMLEEARPDSIGPRDSTLVP